jgi:RNA polymerase sigma factor (sigma-70 family)
VPPDVIQHLAGFAATHRDLLDRLYDRARAKQWELPVDCFDRALLESATHTFAGGLAGAPAIRGYLESLHVEDLALAAACLERRETAWEHFVGTYAERILSAARAIAGARAADDLADGLYGELYGVDRRGRLRRSPLAYYHGRSSLMTWLHAVLARRHVDARRTTIRGLARTRVVAGHRPVADAPLDPEPRRERCHARASAVLARTVRSLSFRDRLRFACYYVDRLPLAAVGRHLDEHESTVSRQLARTRRDLRSSVDARLRQSGLTRAEIALCRTWLQEPSAWDVIVDALGADVAAARSAAGPAAWTRCKLPLSQRSNYVEQRNGRSTHRARAAMCEAAPAGGFGAPVEGDGTGT